jgi:hypothetical protein
MAITTVEASRLTAGGTTIQDYFTALYSWIVSNPGNFTVENAAGGPVSSFTLTHSQGWQINLRVSAGTVLGMIAPDGGIVNSATPGTPSNYSGEAAFLPAITGTSVNCDVIRCSDALTFCLKPAAETYWSYGFHVGKIFTPDNQNDPTDYFIDGLGVLGNIPNLSSGAVGNTWSSSTPAGYVSRIRVSQNLWYPCMFENITNITGVSAQGSRPSPYTIVAAGSSMSSFSPNFGRTKYLRRNNTNLAPFTIVPGVSSTQGWMAYNHLSSNSGNLILWDRTVLP